MKKPNAWQSSAQWRAISSAAISAWNANRWRLPKCGAARKYDGRPCEQPALENGRCRYHGGRTGKGANWGKHRLPPKDAAQWEARLARKFAQIDRDTRRRAQRLAKLTPDQRRRYDAWVESHQPGPASERARRRANRKIAAEIRASLEKPDQKPVTPELAALDAERRRVEAERDRWLRQINTEPTGNVFE
ncbi:hypothetical protein [Mesorhizobium sp. 8]|uniref:hypothetical protein n=1 Tax=Mesorhizobium sp. 8 TaxID=2584466 RepID=UPI00111F1838|nr:hypothetical protein [Mesorhizobium sp. 8]QDC01715.1 hypothetical protein FGU64_15495 [Mesorhizobium sp. 8]